MFLVLLIFALNLHLTFPFFCPSFFHEHLLCAKHDRVIVLLSFKSCVLSNFFMNYHLLYNNYDKSFTRTISSWQTHTHTQKLSSASWSSFSRWKAQVSKGSVTCSKSNGLKVKEASKSFQFLNLQPQLISRLATTFWMYCHLNIYYLIVFFFLFFFSSYN